VERLKGRDHSVYIGINGRVTLKCLREYGEKVWTRLTRFRESVYKTIILQLVLCGCETWRLTLREEQTEGV
jgi:hypothetical protein